MGVFNSDDHYIYYTRQEYLRRNGVAIMVNRVWNAVLGCNLKNDRMISVPFQGKPFNITVIQVYKWTINTEEAEVERFYEGLQDLLELTPKKDVLFFIGDWNAKVGSQEKSRVTGKLGLGVHVESLLLCCWKRVFAVTSVFSWQNSISLCCASFCTPRPDVPVILGVSWLLNFAFQSPIKKRTSFLSVSSRKSYRSS